ncbi:phage tail protein [Buttiauxella sp. 3AFRM03]|uniref:phage tail protein n=1 Tax=Buttiauxella sp. 3AFRM03 TaxID=2479367 RepID=UPI000EF79573|nr:phage tail protein [Buttiauxella sp. 3AFRM03]AYN26400.1 phage tail protein [Buttiauxella sp. 3AFRM03]
MDIFGLATVATGDAFALLDIGVKHNFKTMMTLGDFNFNIDDATYQSIQRSLSWRWVEQQRFGQRDSLQYTGKSTPVISFSGEVYTDNRRISPQLSKMFVGTQPVNELSLLGDVATPKLLISGTGEILGYWVVSEFSDTADRFLMAGIPKHQQFTMTIKYYGDNIYHP